MSRCIRSGPMVLLAAALWLAPAAHAADVQFGPRLSISDDADLGVGADVRWAFLKDDPRLALTLSGDYFFPDNGPDQDEAFAAFRELFGELDIPFNLDSDLEYWEANLNLTWDFTTRRAPVVPYAGLGANYARAKASFLDIETDESDIGVNVLAGMRIKDRFYVEAKQEAGGGDLFVLTVGVRF